MSHYFQDDHRSLGTDDTEARLTALYGSVSLRSRRVDMDDQHVGDDRFSLSTLRLSGGFEAEAELRDGFAIGRLVAGNGRWEVGRLEGDLASQPVLFQPGSPVTARVGELDQDVLSLDRRALQAAARVLYADDALALRFDADPRPVDAGSGTAWSAVLDVALAVRSSLESELVRSSAYRLLVVATLDSFRLVDDHEERRDTAVALLHAHRRATAFIDSHASLPVTVLDVAEAAGVSLHHLRLAFQANDPLGLGPEQTLRRTRLAAADADLRAADPSRGDTVGRIAERWGFPHAGRFARLYREAYGLHPREVLGR